MTHLTVPQRPRLAIVESDSILRTLLARALAIAGFDLLPLASPERLAELAPDQVQMLIVDDDGLGILPTLPHLPTLLLTSAAEDYDQSREQYSVVFKPFLLAELLQAVHGLLSLAGGPPG